MGASYTITVPNVTITAAQDLIEHLAASALSARLKEVHWTQNTEVGDAQAEMLRFTIQRVTGAPTSGLGGTTPTPRPDIPGLVATGTFEANNTTRLTGGTAEVLWAEDCHVANGFHFIAPDDGRFEIAGATRFLVGLEGAPADSLAGTTVYRFENIGGE